MYWLVRIYAARRRLLLHNSIRLARVYELKIDKQSVYLKPLISVCYYVFPFIWSITNKKTEACCFEYHFIKTKNKFLGVSRFLEETLLFNIHPSIFRNKCSKLSVCFCTKELLLYSNIYVFKYVWNKQYYQNKMEGRHIGINKWI